MDHGVRIFLSLRDLTDDFRSATCPIPDGQMPMNQVSPVPHPAEPETGPSIRLRRKATAIVGHNQ